MTKNLLFSIALPIALLAKGCNESDTPLSNQSENMPAGFVSANYATTAEATAPMTNEPRIQQKKTSEYQSAKGATKTAVFQTFKPILAAPIKGERLLIREGYTVSYNTEKRQPNYVAWYLTPQRLKGNNKRSEFFYEDAELNDNEKSLLDDYYNSGFDRGHLCPAGDNKWSRRAMIESFYLSNNSPQTHSLNNESWRILEEACREWVRFGHRNIYIISGPIFSDKQTRKIKRRIPVPAQFFKALLCLDKGKESGIAFIYDNNTENQTMQGTAVSIDKVEEITGYDLFNTVNKNLQEKLERQSNFGAWKRQ